MVTKQDLCKLDDSRYSAWIMPKKWFSLKKRMQGICVYVLEYMFTLE